MSEVLTLLFRTGDSHLLWFEVDRIGEDDKVERFMRFNPDWFEDP